VAKRTPKAEEPAFEEILGKLEHVVEQLEEADLPLEKALAAFEQGVSLSRMGARRLDEAERRIEVLLQDEDGTRRPFETESDEDE
jgi:exodeoxyribonuclease VII small subunit